MRHSEKEERRGRETRGRDQRGGVGGGGSPSEEAEDTEGSGARRGQGGPRGRQSGRQEAGGPGQTMARRSAEPGTKFGVAFAGRGAAVHLDAKERRNEYAARAVIGPPRPPPPPPPHYNFPNRILQSGPYSLAHKQFCFSALEPVNHAEREHLGRRRGPPRALPRAPPRAPPSGFVPRRPEAGGRRVLGWRGTGARYASAVRPGRWGVRVRGVCSGASLGDPASGSSPASGIWLRPQATPPPLSHLLFAPWEMY